MDKKLLGRKINAARKDRGITGEQLAELCSINATYLRQIEAGTKTPSLPVFVTICKELKASPSYLLADSLEGSGAEDMDGPVRPLEKGDAGADPDDDRHDTGCHGQHRRMI